MNLLSPARLTDLYKHLEKEGLVLPEKRLIGLELESLINVFYSQGPGFGIIKLR